MFARLVHRWSLVDGGSFPGSTKAPTTPPSKRIVRPGQCSLCASVAASSGTPTPANTTCPSSSWRALKIASISEAVQRWLSVIVDAPPLVGGLKQLVKADQRQKIRPRLRLIDVALKIGAHAFDWLRVYFRHISL